MSKVFVWEKSTRYIGVVYQPCLYPDGLPVNMNGERKGEYVLIHQVRDDEQEWGLLRFCETYPCPAERKVKIGESYASEPVQTRQDIDKAQAIQGVARYIDRASIIGGNGGSTTTHTNEKDERSTQDRRGHDIERTGSNGEHAQSPEVHSTGEGKTQDNLASDDGTTKVTQPGGCPHCGYRHPPDGMCLK